MFDEIKPQTIDFESIASKSLVTADKELIKQPTLLNIYEGLNTLPLFTSGNISVIKGHSGVRKTTLTSILIGSLLTSGMSEQKFYSNYKNERPIIYFDTEQSEWDAQRNLKAILAKKNSEMIAYYAIADLSSKFRAQFVKFICDKLEPCFVVIDGIRDLILNFNDIGESQELVDLILSIKSKDCHVLNIIHLNKSDGNSKGHLGAFLQEKAETIMKVSFTDTPGISVVECEKKRGAAPFSDFEITNQRGFGELVQTSKAVANYTIEPDKDFDYTEIITEKPF